MAKTYIDKLISLGSHAFSEVPAMLSPEVHRLAGDVSQSLVYMLRKKNGFFAFESALRVFPTVRTVQSYSVSEWNSPELWMNEYHELMEDALFFGEDVFGVQFCVKNGKIFSFDPETAEFSFMADTLELWAKMVLSEFDILTGQPLAHDWQEKNGAIPLLSRLVPKTPFVCGGAFNVTNLVALEAVKSMRARGNLALQIKHLPDGSKIKFEIT